MFNTNNKNLIFSISGVFAIILFAFISMPTNASADNCNNVGYNGWAQRYCGELNYTTGNNYNNGYGNSYGNGNGYGNNNINPAPSITSLSPNGAKTNTNTTIIVNGYNFVSGSVVRLNGVDKQTTFINSTTLRTQINSYDIGNAGDYFVTVSNPIPGGGVSNTMTFSVRKNTVVSGTTTKNTTSKTNAVNKNNTSSTTTTEEANQKATDLAANAMFGNENSFLPSSFFGWIFFFILILLAVILWRKLYVSDEEKHSHLKHA